MRLFDILEATDSIEQRVIKTIRFNARIIQQAEGVNRAEAVYVSIRTMLDSFRAQEHGDVRCKALMKIVERRYPRQLPDVLRYSAWISSHDGANNAPIARIESKGWDLECNPATSLAPSVRQMFRVDHTDVPFIPMQRNEDGGPTRVTWQRRGRGLRSHY
jgi:hypothetical protein